MNKSEITSTILSLLSLGIGVAAIVSEQYRLLIIGLFSLFIAAYFLSALYVRVDENSEEIKKLNEKLRIYEELKNIKADIMALKKEVFRR